jgi:metal transporter CNNM
MYLLSPIGFPFACLLDHLLGKYHDRNFSREGLKTLIMLHEIPRSSLNTTDRLHPLEVSSVCSLLSLSTIPVSDIMTPFKTVFTLSSDTHLNEMTRLEILESSFSKVPVHQPGDSERCYGVMDVKCLATMGLQELDSTVGDLPLEGLTHLSPETSLLDALSIFRNRGAKMVFVSEGGRRVGKALGLLTFRDVMESAIGSEMGMWVA